MTLTAGRNTSSTVDASFSIDDVLYSVHNSRMSDKPHICLPITLEARIDQILSDSRVRAVKFGAHQADRMDDRYITLVLKDGEYRQYSAESFDKALSEAETWLK